MIYTKSKHSCLKGVETIFKNKYFLKDEYGFNHTNKYLEYCKMKARELLENPELDSIDYDKNSLNDMWITNYVSKDLEEEYSFIYWKNYNKVINKISFKEEKKMEEEEKNKYEETNHNMSFFYWRKTIQKWKYISLPKIRTLNNHPKDRSLNSKGKPNHEGLYISRFHKFLRKYWIDEIPQIYWLLKGDLKLVGIRPKEIRDLEDYTPKFRKRLEQNIKYGLISIYYCLKKTKNISNLEALERLYLRKYEKHPIKTDLDFLFGFFRNVLKGKFSE